VRKRQRELVEVIFRIECLKSLEREEVVEMLEPPKPALRSFGRVQNVAEVTTWYATNRTPSGSTEPAKLYAAEFASGLTYGRAVVTIPTTHKPGNIELPSIWRLERAPDPKRHFILKSVSPSSLDTVRAEMKARLDGTDTKVVLLFVHGYNVGFPEAAMRTAQLAYDLRFDGVPMFFSWPSAARATAYFQDAEAAQLSEGAFDRVLEDLAALPATDVYVVAHSMGSRIVTQVLKSRVERGRPTKHVSELLLAAPDINARLFRTVIAPKLAALERTRTTIYASSSDLALRASRTVHGFERVGDTSGKVFVYKGMETIDASKVSLVMRAFGHSYLMDSKSVLKDLHTIVRQRLPAKQRGLVETGKMPDVYWRLD
jgi:esterase/lipase superfamily enzyme